MTASSARFDLRPACSADVPRLLELIHGLAEYERLTHLFECTAARLHASLFDTPAAAHAVIAWHPAPAGEVAAGFALYFYNFSTFLGLKGLYLEDLYVRPEFRQRGCGRALLLRLARIAKAEGCGRFEWSVLDWNTPAQRFYESLGATVLPDWRIVRATGDALDAMARRADAEAHR
jgi:GNAT superfamily N-acetyltransferase